jgi:NADH dehydrogenase
MAKFLPFLPLIGPETRFQPVYVKDVAEAVVSAATTDAAPGVYELGGPEVATFRELMQRLLRIIQRRRMLIAVPFWLARIKARAFDLAPRLTRGLVANSLLTGDQVRLLAHDNIVSPGARGLADLGVAPTAMDAILETYLYVYRPHGQFDAITESAKNLRT